MDEWGWQICQKLRIELVLVCHIIHIIPSFSIIFKIMIHWIERRLELEFYCQFTDEKATKRRRKASDSNKYRLETQNKQIVKSRNLVPIMYVLGKARWSDYVVLPHFKRNDNALGTIHILLKHLLIWLPKFSQKPVVFFTITFGRNFHAGV